MGAGMLVMAVEFASVWRGRLIFFILIRTYAIGAPAAAGTQAFLPAGGSASAGFPAC